MFVQTETTCIQSHKKRGKNVSDFQEIGRTSDLLCLVNIHLPLFLGGSARRHLELLRMPYLSTIWNIFLWSRKMGRALVWKIETEVMQASSMDSIPMPPIFYLQKTAIYHF